MTTAIAIIVAGLLIAGAIYLAVRSKTAPQSDGQEWERKIAKLEKDVEHEKAERNRLTGENKRMFAEHSQLKAELTSVTKERDSIRTTLTKYEAKKEQKEEESRLMTQRLESAQQALKDERQRVIAEEQAKRAREEEERDRIWAEHENTVIDNLTRLCKLPQLQFPTFTNKNLPVEFDGSLKPDFLIELMGQFVIFDAKASKAQSLQTYIDNTIKKTADKVRKNSKIYPHVFLVVPSQALGELKSTVYPKDELTFYVVAREALAPILSSLKRISTYELAEQLDPQKRENILNIIADLDYHINLRNGMDLILTKMGADVLEKAERLDPSLAAEVQQKKSEKKLPQFTTSELKKVVSSLKEQNVAMQQLESPRAPVKKKFLAAAQSAIEEQLL